MKKTNGALSPNMLRNVDAYWRAANYLSVGQIYLLNNPLLKEPLRHEHIKPCLLGHWGTTPDQNFIYVCSGKVVRSYKESSLMTTRSSRSPTIVSSITADCYSAET